MLFWCSAGSFSNCLAQTNCPLTAILYATGLKRYDACLVAKEIQCMVAGLNQIQDGRLTSLELASHQVEAVQRSRLLKRLAPVQEACACEDEMQIVPLLLLREPLCHLSLPVYPKRTG